MRTRQSGQLKKKKKKKKKNRIDAFSLRRLGGSDLPRSMNELEPEQTSRVIWTSVDS